MQAFPNIIAGSLGKGYHSHGASNEKNTILYRFWSAFICCCHELAGSLGFFCKNSQSYFPDPVGNGTCLCTKRTYERI